MPGKDLFHNRLRAGETRLRGGREKRKCKREMPKEKRAHMVDTNLRFKALVEI